MFDVFNDDELLELIRVTFPDLHERSSKDSLNNQVTRLKIKVLIASFLNVLSRTQGMDEHFFKVLRGQLTKFIRICDIEYLQELEELSEHLFSEDPSDFIVGLQRLFDSETGPDAFEKAVEKCDEWEEEMNQIYCLHLPPLNDQPI